MRQLLKLRKYKPCRCRMFSRLFFAVQLAIALAVVSACSSAALPVPAAAGSQLIVKFRDARFTCDRSGIERMSAQTRFTFHWIRQMSGDACVIGVAESDVVAALSALRALPDIEYAEADAPVRAS